ncbi:MAG: zf-HC2 domain-containing protein [Candidatus Eisenbacteria sp.]|nr:zf-HC2 domain-containing protein [Candidatus Eisenbacteria bacterium]
MKCKAARRLFSAYMDRDMTFEEEAKLRGHLDDCPDCNEELAKVQRMVAMLQGLPVVEPGEDFYAQLRAKLHQAEGSERPAPVEPVLPWTERLRAWVGAGSLRPAFGGALGLLVGLMLGVGAPRMVAWFDSSPAPGPGFAEIDGRAVPASAAPDRVPAFGATGGATAVSPLADLDLTHLAAISDTVHLGSEPELILKRYVTDPQRDLIYPDLDYGRTVTGGAGEQSDVFITF